MARFYSGLSRLLAISGTHTVTDVLDGILAGQFVLFDAPDALVIATVLEYPRCRDAFVFAAVGCLAGVESLMPELRVWAVAQGCRRVVWHGRKGWARTFAAKLGAAPKWTVMEVELGRHEDDHK
jgi:hypothetical protein